MDPLPPDPTGSDASNASMPQRPSAPTQIPEARDHFKELTDDDVEEVLADLRNLSHEYRKEFSSAARQLALGGLAVIWIFRVGEIATVSDRVELPPDLMWPMLFFVLALTADFAFWASGAVYWGLDRRLHLRENTVLWVRPLMNLLTRVEHVRGVPAVRLRPAGFLITLEILATAAGGFLLLRFLANRMLF
jgi:hypothetical protein